MSTGLKSLVHKIKDKVHETRTNMKDDKGDQPSEFPRTVSYPATSCARCRLHYVRSSSRGM